LPMGAWARDVDDEGTGHEGHILALDAAVFELDGRARLTVALRGERADPDGLGRRAAAALLDQGATQLLGPRRSADSPEV
jgi:porphobilinogen deaminase